MNKIKGLDKAREPLARLMRRLFNPSKRRSPKVKEKQVEDRLVKRHQNAEFIGQIIDIFEYFLEEKQIQIPNDEKEDDPDAAIIYGSDYGSLQTSLEAMMISWKIMNPL